MALQYEERDGKTYLVIYTRYITRKGKKIPHPTGGVYRFLVEVK